MNRAGSVSHRIRTDLTAFIMIILKKTQKRKGKRKRKTKRKLRPQLWRLLLLVRISYDFFCLYFAGDIERKVQTVLSICGVLLTLKVIFYQLVSFHLYYSSSFLVSLHSNPNSFSNHACRCAKTRKIPTIPDINSMLLTQ